MYIYVLYFYTLFFVGGTRYDLVSINNNMFIQNKDISEFAICHVVRHGTVSGSRIQWGPIVGLLTVEGF